MSNKAWRIVALLFIVVPIIICIIISFIITYFPTSDVSLILASDQVGWTTLVLKWEDDEKQGIEVKTPSDMFKWNQLGELYQWFTDTYSYLSLAELKDRLKENITSIHTMIDSMSDEELFQPHMRKWADDATKTAIWEVYKFIHINTVAPFGTFRTKIRKWKRVAL